MLKSDDPKEPPLMWPGQWWLSPSKRVVWMVEDVYYDDSGVFGRWMVKFKGCPTSEMAEYVLRNWDQVSVKL